MCGTVDFFAVGSRSMTPPTILSSCADSKHKANAKQNIQLELSTGGRDLLALIRSVSLHALAHSLHEHPISSPETPKQIPRNVSFKVIPQNDVGGGVILRMS